MFFIRYFLLSIFFISLFSCEFHEDKKKHFQQVVENAIKGKETAILTLGELFDFQWDKVCFGIAPNLYLEFFNNDGANFSFDIKSKVRVREEYVKGSPSGKCFSRKREVKLQVSFLDGKKIIYLSVVD